MIVTLYKDCILNKSKSEVFRTKALLEEYLSNISVKKSFSINPINISKSGLVKLYDTPLNRNLFLYNYMKIQDTEENPTVIVYAYIDRVYTENELFCFQYDTDVWHTYLGEWEMRLGYLTNCYAIENYTQDIKEFEFPVEYIGTSVTYRELYNKEHNENIYVVITIQDYILTSGTQTSTGSIRSYIIGENEQDSPSMYSIFPYPYTPTKTLLGSLIERLTLYQTTGELNLRDASTANRKYNLLNIYIINADMINLENIGIPTASPFDTIYDTTNNDRIKLYQFYGGTFFSTNLAYHLNLKTIYNYNPETISIGFYTDMYNIPVNNFTTNLSLTIYNNQGSITFLLELNGIVYDITDDYELNITSFTITADMYEQRKIQIELSRKEAVLGIVKGSIGAIASLSNPIINNKYSSVIMAGANKLSKFNQPESYDLYNIENGINEINKRDVISGVSGITDIISSVNKLKALNAEQYSNVKSNNCPQKAVINQSMGLIIKEYNRNDDVDTNRVEFYRILTTCGYNVNCIINDISSNRPDNVLGYDVLKFSSVIISGLSTELNDEISSILMNGVRIWYSPSPIIT